MALSISSCCVRMHDYIYTHIILLRTKVKGEECFVRSNVGCLAGSKTNFIVEPAVNHGPVQIIRSSSKVKNASVTSAREDNNVHKHCREEEKTSLNVYRMYSLFEKSMTTFTPTKFLWEFLKILKILKSRKSNKFVIRLCSIIISSIPSFLFFGLRKAAACNSNPAEPSLLSPSILSVWTFLQGWLDCFF